MKRAMSSEKRKYLTEKILSELKAKAAEGNAEAARKLALYDYINNVARSTREERLYYLSCERLLIMHRCPVESHDGGTEIIGRKYCHKRYWCMACAKDGMDRQLDRWTTAIKLSLCSPVGVMWLGMYLGPIVAISWAIPDPEDQSSLKSFRKYLKQTFPAKLATLGAVPGSWMMASAFDPVRKECRALYMGISLEWSKICNARKRRQARSTRSAVASYTRPLATTELVLSRRGRLGEGQPSPWKPKIVRTSYLLDDEKNPVAAADKLFKLIQDGLNWVLGELVDVFELTPERAFRLHKLYHGRHLTSTYGMVYGLSDAVGTADGLKIYVERRDCEGDITVEELDPLDVVGSISTDQHEHLTKSPNEAADGRCSVCGRKKETKFEENRRYRPRPVAVQQRQRHDVSSAQGDTSKTLESG